MLYETLKKRQNSVKYSEMPYETLKKRQKSVKYSRGFQLLTIIAKTLS